MSVIWPQPRAPVFCGDGRLQRTLNEAIRPSREFANPTGRRGEWARRRGEQAGGRDNISVVLLEFDQVDVAAKPIRKTVSSLAPPGGPGREERVPSHPSPSPVHVAVVGGDGLSSWRLWAVLTRCCTGTPTQRITWATTAALLPSTKASRRACSVQPVKGSRYPGIYPLSFECQTRSPSVPRSVSRHSRPHEVREGTSQRLEAEPEAKHHYHHVGGRHHDHGALHYDHGAPPPRPQRRRDSFMSRRLGILLR